MPVTKTGVDPTLLAALVIEELCAELLASATAQDETAAVLREIARRAHGSADPRLARLAVTARAQSTVMARFAAALRIVAGALQGAP